jgi:hypothetical protein
MLLYYFILIIILSSGIGVYMYHNYAYNIFDRQYDIPLRSSFNHQNCQLDGSCLTPFSNDPNVPPMPNLRSPFMGRNKICLKSTYVPITLPQMFFTRNYGWGMLS